MALVAAGPVGRLSTTARIPQTGRPEGKTRPQSNASTAWGREIFLSSGSGLKRHVDGKCEPFTYKQMLGVLESVSFRLTMSRMRSSVTPYQVFPVRCPQSATGLGTETAGLRLGR